METSIHLIFTAILALALYPFFGPAVIILFLGGWLIDSDHFVWWVLTRRNLSIRKMFHYHNIEAPKDNYHADDGDLYLGHTVEFLLLAIITSFYHPFALIFLIGLLGHYILDAIWLATIPRRAVLNHSILYWLWLRMSGRTTRKEYQKVK